MGRAARVNAWKQALDQALEQLAQAEHAFEWADAEYADFHAYRIQAAQEQVSVILRQARRAYGVEAPNRQLSERQTMNAITSGDVAESRR